VAVPVAPVRTEDGEMVAVKPVCACVVTVRVIGTPSWPLPSFAVTVIGAEPATKAVAPAGVTLTTVFPLRSYAVHVGPGYDPPRAESVMVVVNVPVGGAAVIGDAVLAVIDPRGRTSEKPGRRLPVNSSADAVDIARFVKYVQTPGAVQGPVAGGVNANPLGVKIVIDVIAYAFEIGLAIVTVVPDVAVLTMYAE